MRVATTTEFNHPAVHVVQQVGQTLTETSSLHFPAID